MITTHSHTPTPWKVYADNIIVARKMARPVHIAMTTVDMPTAVSIPAHQQVQHEERDANTAFIVLAVNSHEALVEACKLQHQALDELCARLVALDRTFYPSSSGMPWEAMLKGNTAIAAAEGKTP